MKISYLIGAIVAASAGGLFWVNAALQKLSEPMHMNMPTRASSSTPMVAKVAYSSDRGFVPQMVTIKVGGTVTFKSTDGSDIWVASGEHANHAQYSGTTEESHCPDITGAAFDQCAPAESFSFIFQKVGDWDFHNHLREEDTGMVTVVE